CPRPLQSRTKGGNVGEKLIRRSHGKRHYCEPLCADKWLGDDLSAVVVRKRLPTVRIFHCGEIGNWYRAGQIYWLIVGIVGVRHATGGHVAQLIGAVCMSEIEYCCTSYISDSSR